MWVDSLIMSSSRLKKLIYSSRAHSIKLTLPDNRLERRVQQLFRHAKNCLKMLMKYCVKIVQIRNRKNFLFGHFSRNELVIFVNKLAGWSTETYYVRLSSHERQNELIPVWDFKPAWKQVLFTWSFVSAAFQNDPKFWWICLGISFRVVFT